MENIPHLAEAFGQVLRCHRERAQLTQEGLALKIGSVSSYIRFLEHGQKIPTLTTFHNLCNALEVNPHEFMSGYMQELTRLTQNRGGTL